MYKLAKEGEVVTIDNMGSDWININYGRYRPIVEKYVYTKKGNSMSWWKAKKVLLYKDDIKLYFNSSAEAAEYVGVHKTWFSKCLLAGNKIRGWNCRYLKDGDGENIQS